jgi:hypothetical protein
VEGLRGNQTKTVTLDAIEFIRRFLLHILPGGFVRIRQFGFLANRARGKKLALCRALLGAPRALAIAAATADQDENAGEEIRKHCPVCKTGHMILIAIIHAGGRAAPYRGWAHHEGSTTKA